MSTFFTRMFLVPRFGYQVESLVDPLSQFRILASVTESHTGMPTRPMGVSASPDGSQIYVPDFDGSAVRRFETTNFDVLSMTLASTDSLPNVGPMGFDIGFDGTHMFLVDNSPDVIVRAILDTPFDTSSYSGVQQLAANSTATPTSVRVSKDGLNVYAIWSGTVEWYQLGAPNNLVSPTPIQNLGHGFGFGGIRSVCPNADGTRLYVTTHDKLYSFIPDTPYDPSSVTQEPTVVDLSQFIEANVNDHPYVWVDEKEENILIGQMGYYANGGVYHMRRQAPPEALNPLFVKTMSATPRTSGILLSDGTVAAWGDNYNGMISGAAAVSNAISLSGSGNGTNAVCLKDIRSIQAYGSNSYGVQNEPSQYDFIQADAAGTHAVGLRNDGSVVSWGTASGVVGSEPVLNNAIQVAAGRDQDIALLADGTVIVWGNDTYGQVTDASLVSNVVYVESGTSTCFAVHGDGSVTRWGLTSGAGAIPALSNVVKIAAGLTHALALLSDGTVVGWGSNTNGMATPPEGLTDVVEIAASQYHSMARKSDGSVVCWGQNTFGECDVPLEYQPT